jgi:DNA-binding MarR family transcriptional regulator
VAERFGMDPTTLNRSIKPLIKAGWIAVGTDPQDGRARILAVTPAGRAKLAEALPLWRAAEAEVEQALGLETTLAIKGLLDLATARLSSG